MKNNFKILLMSLVIYSNCLVSKDYNKENKEANLIVDATDKICQQMNLEKHTPYRISVSYEILKGQTISVKTTVEYSIYRKKPVSHKENFKNLNLTIDNINSDSDKIEIKKFIYKPGVNPNHMTISKNNRETTIDFHPNSKIII